MSWCGEGCLLHVHVRSGCSAALPGWRCSKEACPCCALAMPRLWMGLQEARGSCRALEASQCSCCGMGTAYTAVGLETVSVAVEDVLAIVLGFVRRTAVPALSLGMQPAAAWGPLPALPSCRGPCMEGMGGRGASSAMPLPSGSCLLHTSCPLQVGDQRC